MSLARLIVVSPEELSDGFRLTGVAVEQAETSPVAERIVRDLISSGESGVIAVYRPLFDGFDDDLRRRLKASVSPVVVELPEGVGVEPDELRRSRLADRIQRAIGYHVTFGEDET